MNQGYIAEQLARLSDAIQERKHVQVVYTDELNEFLVDLLDRYKRDLLTSYAQQTKKNPSKWVDMNIHLLPAREYISSASVPVESEEDSGSGSEPSVDTEPLTVPVRNESVCNEPVIEPAVVNEILTEIVNDIPIIHSDITVTHQSSDIDADINIDVDVDADNENVDITEIPDTDNPNASDDDDIGSVADNFIDDLEIDELAEYPHLEALRIKYTGTLIMYSANRHGVDGMMIASVSDDPFPPDLHDLLSFMKSDPEYHTIFGLPCTEGNVCEIVSNNTCFFTINKRYRHTEDYVCTRLKGIFGCVRT